MKPEPQRVRLAAVLGFLAVALGAAGAHGGIEAILNQRDTVDIWKTASHYHFVHAVALLILAIVGDKDAVCRYAWWTLLAGVLIFSGTLYVLAATGIKWLGAVTPVGGLLLLVGWLLIALGKWRTE